MISATATLPRPPVYGIASWRVGTTDYEFEIGWDEFGRDTDWAEAQLRAVGLGSGDLVLVTTQNCEGPWFSPFVRALRRIGVTYLCGEVWGFDARRTSMFLQRLPVKAVLGLAGETVAALEQQQPPIAELMRDVELVWARRDAIDRLRGLAPEVLPVVPLGPAVALGRPGEPGAIVNTSEWTVDSENGQLLISSVRERATRFDRVPTGVRGSVGSAQTGTITVGPTEATTA